MHTTKHLSQAIYIKQNADAIKYAYDVTADPESYNLNEDEIAMQYAYKKQWEPELVAFETSGMLYVVFFYMQWMYVFQLFF